MIGVLRKIEKKEFSTKDGRKFTKIEFVVDVETDEKRRIVKTLKGSYGEDYAKKYFAYCKVKTKDLIGKEVECVVAKRSYDNAEGEKRYVEYIRFMNVLDKEGKAIIMPKEGVTELDF